MKRFFILFFSILSALSLSACEKENNFQEHIEDEQGNNDTEEPKGQTLITLTIGDKVLDAYLNETEAAKDLISRLPLTVHLSNSGHDYCGDINPPLSYNENEIQNGWKDGDLAFWTTGNDFVIFHDDEETSASTGNLVVIGHVTSDINEIRNLKENIDVTIALKENNQDNENMEKYRIRIKVANQELTATLLNNATTRAFIDMLPITLPMLDLYGREMCYRFPDALPTDDVKTSGYEVGEIVYYPPRHSFVILYAQNGEHFSMQKLGTVDANVEVFDNIGDVDITFELINK